MTLKTGQEPFHAAGRVLNRKLLDYWRWAGSDLLSNTSRGILAEFLVGSALGMTEEVRTEWGLYDLLTPAGIKVEVKNSAYIQSWHQEEFSRISFDIAPKHGWDPSTNKTIDDIRALSTLIPPRRQRTELYGILCQREARRAASPPGAQMTSVSAGGPFASTM